MNKEGFHGLKTFIKKKYWLDEVHNRDEIIGKWCIGIELPGVNHKPMLFTMSVRGHDTEETSGPEDDPLCIKRPAIFNSSDDCKKFMTDLNFPQYPLKLIRIGDYVFNHQVFAQNGAYLVHEPTIALV